MRMKDKVAIVTGGATGIGREIARTFAKEGARVAIADLQLPLARDAVAAIESAGGQALAVGMDVTSEQQVEAGVRTVIDRFGGVDVLVSNAGVQQVAALVDLPFEGWRRLLAIHLDGAFLTTRACLRDMYKRGKGGSIIYMGSVHSVEASPLKAPYVTAKHGLMGLCRVVAKEGAAHGVRANLIGPGYVRTALVEKQIPEQAKNLGISEAEVVKNVMLKTTVDGEFTTTADIAQVEHPPMLAHAGDRREGPRRRILKAVDHLTLRIESEREGMSHRRRLEQRGQAINDLSQPRVGHDRIDDLAARREKSQPIDAPFAGKGDVVREAGKIVDEDVGESLLRSTSPITPDAVAGRLANQHERLVRAHCDPVGEIQAPQRKAHSFGLGVVLEQTPVRSMLQDIFPILVEAVPPRGVREVDLSVGGDIDIIGKTEGHPSLLLRENVDLPLWRDRQEPAQPVRGDHISLRVDGHPQRPAAGVDERLHLLAVRAQAQNPAVAQAGVNRSLGVHRRGFRTERNSLRQPDCMGEIRVGLVHAG